VRELSVSGAWELRKTLEEFSADLSDRNRVLLSTFRVVVAQGVRIPANSLCNIAVGSQALTLFSPQWEQRVMRYQVDDLLSVEVGGPGIVQTGGGFIGGGFGAAGMIEGMAVASALNTLTKKTKINNIVAVLARENALVLHNSLFNPASLEMAFVPIKSAMAQAAARRAAEPAPAPPAQPSRYDQLKQLAELRAMGALTDDEFESEKAKVLGQA
jgi:Short C-terminal domain